uniref:Uncharacterized protein n=1 Tax=Arundo donax TaxID=35708 RepID=A0A0A9BWI9_ARUDO
MIRAVRQFQFEQG